MTAREIERAIVTGDFTSAELEILAQAIKFQRSALSRVNTRKFSAGDTVTFTNPRSGASYRGTVDRVKQKYVLVNTAQGRYNVPANLLETA